MPSAKAALCAASLSPAAPGQGGVAGGCGGGPPVASRSAATWAAMKGRVRVDDRPRASAARARAAWNALGRGRPEVIADVSAAWMGDAASARPAMAAARQSSTKCTVSSGLQGSGGGVGGTGAVRGGRLQGGPCGGGGRATASRGGGGGGGGSGAACLRCSASRRPDDPVFSAAAASSRTRREIAARAFESWNRSLIVFSCDSHLSMHPVLARPPLHPAGALRAGIRPPRPLFRPPQSTPGSGAAADAAYGWEPTPPPSSTSTPPKGTKGGGRLVNLPVSSIRRPLVRPNDKAKVEALMASIAENGLREPIDVL